MTTGALWSPPRVQSKLVSLGGFPFNENFFVFYTISTTSILVLDVVTSYKKWFNAATVRINGNDVGKIPPYPFSLTGGAFIPVTIPFHIDVLGRNVINGVSYVYSINQLEIIPSSLNDWLIIGPWRIHYNQQSSYPVASTTG